MLPAEVIQAIVTAVAAVIAWFIGRKFPSPSNPLPVTPVPPVQPTPPLPALPERPLLDWVIRNAPDLLKLIRLIPVQVVEEAPRQTPVYGDLKSEAAGGGYEVPLTLVVRVPSPTVETMVSPK